MKTNDIKIIALNAFKDNYIWCLCHGNQVLIVDPGESEVVLSFLKKEQLELAGILVTHHHWDHTDGIKGILEKHPVPVYGSKQSLCASITKRVTEQDELHFEYFNITLRILEIPGHTLDHIAFYNAEMAFVGDTLFSSGCGRVFEGTMDMMYASLTKLKNLNDNTKIYCGHEYTLANLKFAAAVEPLNLDISQKQLDSEIMIRNKIPTVPSLMLSEKRTNSFLRCEHRDVIESARKYASDHGISLDDTNPARVFELLRNWKNDFKL